MNYYKPYLINHLNMQNESDIKTQISDLSKVIEEKFPEILIYVQPEPLKENNENHINYLEKLIGYRDSIQLLLSKYIKERETIMLNRTKYKGINIDSF